MGRMDHILTDDLRIYGLSVVLRSVAVACSAEGNEKRPGKKVPGVFSRLDHCVLAQIA